MTTPPPLDGGGERLAAEHLLLGAVVQYGLRDRSADAVGSAADQRHLSMRSVILLLARTEEGTPWLCALKTTL
jgi:hypothetical protein